MSSDASTKPGPSGAPAGSANPGQISLQIISPPTNGSGNSNNIHSVGGWGEWSQKITSLGCIGMFTTLLIGAALSVAVTGLVLVYKDDPSLVCVGSLGGVSFSYITWLRVMGFTFIGSMLLEIAFVCAHGISGTIFTSKAATYFGGLMYLFQVVWYVVGAILYFKTVSNNCDSGTQIQTFSLALFIIQTTVVVCLYCGRRAVHAIS